MYGHVIPGHRVGILTLIHTHTQTHCSYVCIRYLAVVQQDSIFSARPLLNGTFFVRLSEIRALFIKRRRVRRPVRADTDKADRDTDTDRLGGTRERKRDEIIIVKRNDTLLKKKKKNMNKKTLTRTCAGGHCRT